MEVSGQLHGQGDLPVGKEAPLLTGKEAEWVSRVGQDAAAKKKI
jgi:hypothetical protein